MKNHWTPYTLVLITLCPWCQGWTDSILCLQSSVIFLFKTEKRPKCVTGSTFCDTLPLLCRAFRLPKITVWVDYPEASRLYAFSLMLHGPFTPQHPQRELVDSRLEHRPELPVHEAGLVQAVILGYDLFRALQLDETRLVKRRRLPGCATQPAGRTLLGGGTLLKTLADTHISRGDETLLLRRVRPGRMPPGDGGDAAPEKTAVPVQVGLDSDVPLQVFAPGLLDAPAAACRRRRGQMF